MDLSETSLTSQLYFHSETGNLSKSTRYIFSYPLQKENDWTVVGLAQEMAEMYSIFDKLFSLGEGSFLLVRELKDSQFLVRMSIPSPLNLP